MHIKDVGKRILERAGFVIHRAPANRFEAMETSLRQLRDDGYRPCVVIDCGANCGQWFAIASAVFPESDFHLIEPQEECWAALDPVVRRRGRAEIHRTAVTAPGRARVRMHRGGGEQSTGAFVIPETDPSPADLTAAAATLDSLFAARIRHDDRTLLKLDIEGHELEALRGASDLLGRIEVLLCEVRFFDVHQSGSPVFGALLAFIEARGFSLFDFASLNERRTDHRLWTGDAIFIRHGSALLKNVNLE